MPLPTVQYGTPEAVEHLRGFLRCVLWGLFMILAGSGELLYATNPTITTTVTFLDANGTPVFDANGSPILDSNGQPRAQSFNLCTDVVCIRFEGKDVPLGVGSGLSQVLPAGWIVPDASFVTPYNCFLTWAQGSNVIQITSTFSNFSYTVKYHIPCDTAYTPGQQLDISYVHHGIGTPDFVNNNGNSGLNTNGPGNPCHFNLPQFKRSQMNIMNFQGQVEPGGILLADLPENPGMHIDSISGLSVPDTCPPPQKLLTGPDQCREFDLVLSDGMVSGFTFYYTPEQEITKITNKDLIFTNPANGATITVTPTTTSGTSEYTFTAAMLQTAGFASGRMTYGDKVHVKECFDVEHCSAVTNDDTEYRLVWNCWENPAVDHGCNSTVQRRSILVEAATDGIDVSLSFRNQSTLDYCGNIASDIVITLTNTGPDTSKSLPGPCPIGSNYLAGSALKRIHTFTFRMNQSVFKSMGDICIEAGGVPVKVTNLPTGFYDYNANTNLVTLNFDLLQNNTGLPLLLDGYFQTGHFNALYDSTAVSLVIKQVKFDCQKGLFYPTADFPKGFGFDHFQDKINPTVSHPYSPDVEKPGVGFMFFGRDFNDHMDIDYEDMCRMAHHQESDVGNFHNEFPITTDTHAACLTCLPPYDGGQDLFVVGDQAQIDFQWCYNGTEPVPSPFRFTARNTPSAYFDCGVPTYRAKVTIPEFYDLTTVTYFPAFNLSNTANPIGLPLPILQPPLITINGKQFRCYEWDLPANAFCGRIAAVVELNQCNDAGGVDAFTTQVQAVCNGCTACPSTMATIDAFLNRHCPNACVGSPAKQNTHTFDYTRLDVGILKGITTPFTTLRAYACDRLEFTSEGEITPSAGNLLAYRIDYPAPINFQFLEFIEGELKVCDSLSTVVGTYVIGAADLATTFLGTGGWPAVPAQPNNLFINFTNASGNNSTTDYNTFLAAIQSTLGKKSLKLTFTVRIRPMSGDFVAGSYDCELKGQFWSGTQGTQGYSSCDPYIRHLKVLGVTTTPYSKIFPSGGEGLCNRLYEFGTRVDGGMGLNVDEFELECRSIFQWPNEITMGTLPPGTRFNGLPQFTPDGTEGTGASLVDGMGANTDKLKITGDGTGGWPSPDRDGRIIDFHVWGSIANDCPIMRARVEPIIDSNGKITSVTIIRAGFGYSGQPQVTIDDPNHTGPAANITAIITGGCLTGFNIVNGGTGYSASTTTITIADPNGDVLLTWPYINNVYTGTNPSINADCRTVHLPDTLHYTPAYDLNAIPADPSISLCPASPHYKLTDLTVNTNGDYVGIIPGIKFSYSGAAGSKIENAWMTVTSNCFQTTAIHVNNGPAMPLSADGTFHVGTIESGNVNAAVITLDIKFLAGKCQPGEVCDVTLTGGFSCAGYPPMNKPCLRTTCKLAVTIEESGLTSILNLPLAADADCGEKVTSVLHLVSKGLARVKNPQVCLTLPLGAVFDPATYTADAVDNGTHTILHPAVPVLSGGKYCFDLDTDVYSGKGMPGTLASLDLTFCIKFTTPGNRTVLLEPAGEDLCGHPVPCTTNSSYTLTVVDIEDPVITFVPPGGSIPCNPNPATLSSLSDAYIKSLVLASDDCGPPTIIVTHVDSLVGCVWTRKFTIKAKDTVNKTTATVSYTWIEDHIPPAITGLNVVNTTCLAGLAGVPPVAIHDNCDADADLITTCVQNPANPVGSCGVVITRSYTAKDTCGNMSSFVQTINVNDTIRPVSALTPAEELNFGFRPNLPLVIECGDSATLAAALAFVPLFTDNCSPAVTLILPSTTGSPLTDVTTPDPLCPHGYLRTRTWLGRDDCGNLSLPLVQTIQVVDTTPPVFVNCPADIDLGCLPTSIPEADPTVTATDCDDAPVMLVSSRGTNKVLRYNANTGAFMGVFVAAGSGGLVGPRGLAFGRDGHLYVASNDNTVKRYDGSTGVFLGDFVTPGLGGLSLPIGLTFGGPNGDLYVASSNTNNVICYNHLTGAVISTFNTPAGTDAATTPRGLAFAANGDLCVACNGAGLVKRYDGNTGAYITGLDIPVTTPYGLAFDVGGNLFVARQSASRVRRFDPSGGSLGDIDASNTGGLSNPRSFAFGPAGDLFVSSGNNDRVLKYSASGYVPSTFVPTGYGGLDTPTFLTFTTTPHVTSSWVDTANGSLHTRTITYTATDLCGNKSTCTQHITWRSDTLPVIEGCVDIVRDCTDDSGALVEFTCPNAISPCCPTGPVIVSCDYSSPHQFPIGVTPVTVTALDDCGRTSVCTFTVTVLGHGVGKWQCARRGGNGGGGPDSGKAVAVDAVGNIFMAGSITVAGKTMIQVEKYDAACTMLWNFTAGGTGNATGRGVTVDDAGNAYVTGDYTSTATVSLGNGVTLPPSGGGAGILVAKFNSGGTCLWALRVGGAGEDYGAGIAWTPVGDQVFVTGQYGPGSAGAASPGGQAFILSVSSAGTYNKMKYSEPFLPYDTTQYAIGKAVAVDSLGYVYITGIYGGIERTIFLTNTVPPSPSSGRMFVVKFDNALTSCATTHSGFTGPGSPASGSLDGFGIAVSAESHTDPQTFDCYVTGNFYGADSGSNAGVANFGNNVWTKNAKNTPSGQPQLGDLLIVKFRSKALNAFTPLWVRKGGDNSAIGDFDAEVESRGIALDPAGNPYVTGFIHPNAPGPYVNDGRTVLVASYSSAGSLRWMNNAESGGGLDENVGLGIAVDAAGCVHITGDFTNPMDFPPLPTLTATTATARNLFVAKMCPACSCDGPNLVVNGSFEDPATGANGAFNYPNGQVPGWNGFQGSCGGPPALIEINHGTNNGVPVLDGQQHLELSSNVFNEAVCQTVEVTAGCPTTLCFWYSGSAPAGATTNNQFTLDLSGAYTMSAQLVGRTTVPPSVGVWQQHCTTFKPAVSGPLTISFGRLGTNQDDVWGVHIDKVTLTQNCCDDSLTDSDGDGMPDAWELLHNLNPNNPADAASDLDGDGQTNLQEYLAGTDPNDSHSLLWLEVVGLEADTIRLRFEAVADHSYTLEWTPALPSGPPPAGIPWTAIYNEPAQPVGHIVELIVPRDGQPRGFYRVRTP